MCELAPSLGRPMLHIRHDTCRRSVLTLLLAPLAVVGCGPTSRLDTYPVSGQVSVDGEPTDNVVVRFHHQDPSVTGDARSPAAKTDAEGRFRLTTAVDAEGAIAGTYRVSFAWMSGNQLTSTDRFDGSYSDPATSGVEVEVPHGGIDLPPFRLSSHGPTGRGR